MGSAHHVSATTAQAGLRRGRLAFYVRVIDWAVGDRVRSDLTLDALRKAPAVYPLCRWRLQLHQAKSRTGLRNPHVARLNWVTLIKRLSI